MSALKRRLDRSLTAQAVLAFLLALSITALFSRPDEHPASWLLRSVLITVGVLILGAFTGSLSLPVFSAVLLIGISCWTLWMRRRSMDRCRHMQSALREQDARVP